MNPTLPTLAPQRKATEELIAHSTAAFHPISDSAGQFPGQRVAFNDDSPDPAAGRPTTPAEQCTGPDRNF
jgi:hypothetical protein